MNVTIYKRPNGASEIVDVTNVYPEDEEFFTENEIVISMEDIGGDYVAYGRFSNQSEIFEESVIAHGRSCEDTLAELADLLRDQQTK